MKRIEIMVDIETLGKALDPTVTQISAAAFNIGTGEIVDEFNEYIHIPEKLNIDNSTIIWWLSENPELLKNILTSCGAAENNEKDVISNFVDWVNELKTWYNQVYLWGNGILFDNRIISQKCQKYDIEYPIFYRNDRDMRTIVDLAATKMNMDSEDYRAQFEFDGTEHDALCDVKHQIKVVCNAYQTLGLA